MVRERPRVVVTGVGLVTPLGVGRKTFWSNLLSGACAAGEVRAFDTSRYRVHTGCEVRGFDFAALMQRPPPRGMGTAAQFAIAATALALADGRLSTEELDWRRVGVSVGTTCGEIRILEDHDAAAVAGGSCANADDWLTHHPACAIPASIGHWFGFAGPNVIIPTACA